MLTKKCILALECAVTSFIAINAPAYSQETLAIAADEQVAKIIRDIENNNRLNPNDLMKTVTIGDESSMIHTTVRLKYAPKPAPKNRFGFVFRSICPSHEVSDFTGTSEPSNLAKAIAEITEMQNFYKLG